jgi:hypothetical protein
MATIEIFVKNMMGDIVTLSVNPSLGLDGVYMALRNMDPETYSNDFHLFSLEDEKEEESNRMTTLIEGMMLCVLFFPPPSLISTTWYNNLDEFVFDVNGQTIYVYTLVNVNHRTYYCVSRKQLMMDDMDRPNNYGNPGEPYHDSLYTAYMETICQLSAKSLKVMNDIIFEHLHLNRDEEATYHWEPTEPYLCDCGSVIQRRSLASHQKTKKHKLACEF